MQRKTLILTFMKSESIKDFERIARVKLGERNGKPYYGGYLDLRGTGITSLPDGLTVGGWLDLSGTGITDTHKVSHTLSVEQRRKIEQRRKMIVVWEWNGRTYINVDGIFSVVDSHHGNVWRVHQIGGNKQQYIVTDGDNHYAHGDTLEEARRDLLYKICDRDKSEYDGLTLDSELPYNEAVEWSMQTRRKYKSI